MPGGNGERGVRVPAEADSEYSTCTPWLTLITWLIAEWFSMKQNLYERQEDMTAPLTRDEALDLVGKRLPLLGFPGWIEVQPTLTRAIIVMLVAHAGLDHAVMEIEAAIDYDNAELQASHDEAERLIPGGSGVSEASLDELGEELTNQ